MWIDNQIESIARDSLSLISGFVPPAHRLFIRKIDLYETGFNPYLRLENMRDYGSRNKPGIWTKSRRIRFFGMLPDTEEEKSPRKMWLELIIDDYDPPSLLKFVELTFFSDRIGLDVGQTNNDNFQSRFGQAPSRRP